MLLASLAVHLLLLVLHPFDWLPRHAPPRPEPLQITLASPPTSHAAVVRPPAAPAVPAPHAPKTVAPSHRQREPVAMPPKSPAHRPQPSNKAPSSPATPLVTAEPRPPHPAKPSHTAPVEPDAPPAGGRFSAQSLLSQGRSAARALDSADDGAETTPSNIGSRQLLVYGRSATGTEWDSYVNAWLQKIERIGARDFPEVPPGQLVRLRLTVVIDSSGALRSVKLRRGSGLPAFDQAAMALVQRAAPFAPFPAALAARASALKFDPPWSISRDNQFAGG
ncbi:TonB family protein [Neisseriaceae bacterium JH1-16]|nr:TonB family protein [Neisseriaceae bacterium JH1-16]